MRHVEIQARVLAENAEHVFENVLRWDRYPELAPHVRATTVHATLPEPKGSSSWELHFRSGLLRWTEDDVFDRERLQIRFEQSDGDFDEFTGVWSLRQDGDDVSVHFSCDFDFGIPSLEGILDPIAARVIKETVAWAVSGLFASVEITADPEIDLSNSTAGAAATTAKG